MRDLLMLTLVFVFVFFPETEAARSAEHPGPESGGRVSEGETHKPSDRHGRNSTA